MGALAGCVADAEGPSTLDAVFDFEWEAESSTLTIVHAGGDEFDRENTGKLVVEAAGIGLEERWDRPVDAGTNTTVTDSQLSRTPLAVVWHAPVGDGTAVVGRKNDPSRAAVGSPTGWL